jgi:hypothetical protein
MVVIAEAPSSPGQRLLWLLDRYRGGGGMLNCPLVCRLHGRLDLALLSAAVDALTARHEALRTTFVRRGRELRQLIHAPGPVPIARRDCSGAADPEAAVRAALAGELRSSIDCEHWPTRATLWRLGPEDHVVCWNMNHLVTDLWSCGILADELETLLARSADPAQLPAAGLQYRQFCEWQESEAARGELRRHEGYWRRQLAGLQPLALPFRPARAQRAGARGAERAEIGAEAAGKLRVLARESGTTPFAVMLAVFYAYVHRHAGQTDLAVASLFANRSRLDFARTVGFLVNMVALRTRVPAPAGFTELLARTHATVVEAFVHQAAPFHMVSGASMPAGVARFDDVVFHMAAEPIHRARAAGVLELEVLVPDVTGRFAFELAVMPSESGLAVKLFHSEGLLDAGAARALVEGYAALATAVAEQASNCARPAQERGSGTGRG